MHIEPTGIYTPAIRATAPRDFPLRTRGPRHPPRGITTTSTCFLSTNLTSAYLQVIATRPVQGISLSLFSEHGYRALEVLARTSMPVRRLTILIVDASAPNELFPQLAARLPHLEALHIVALVQNYDLVRTLSLSLLFFPALRELCVAGNAACIVSATGGVRWSEIFDVHGYGLVVL